MLQHCKYIRNQSHYFQMSITTNGGIIVYFRYIYTFAKHKFCLRTNFETDSSESKILIFFFAFDHILPRS